MSLCAVPSVDCSGRLFLEEKGFGSKLSCKLKGSPCGTGQRRPHNNFLLPMSSEFPDPLSDSAPSPVPMTDSYLVHVRPPPSSLATGGASMLEIHRCCVLILTGEQVAFGMTVFATCSVTRLSETSGHACQLCTGMALGFSNPWNNRLFTLVLSLGAILFVLVTHIYGNIFP